MPIKIKAARGAPKTVPTQADIAKIEKLTSEGCSQIEVAREIGINRDRLYRWRREFPEVGEAMEAGLAKEHKALRSVLIEKALAGDTVCILFALKSRHGYREHAPVEQESRVNIQISLPGALSAEQYGKVIDHGQS